MLVGGNSCRGRTSCVALTILLAALTSTGVPPSSEPVYALYKAFLSSLEALIHDGVQVVTPGFLGYESNVNIDETDVQHQCKEGWPQSP